VKCTLVFLLKRRPYIYSKSIQRRDDPWIRKGRGYTDEVMQYPAGAVLAVVEGHLFEERRVNTWMGGEKRNLQKTELGGNRAWISLCRHHATRSHKRRAIPKKNWIREVSVRSQKKKGTAKGARPGRRGPVDGAFFEEDFSLASSEKLEPGPSTVRRGWVVQTARNSSSSLPGARGRMSVEGTRPKYRGESEETSLRSSLTKINRDSGGRFLL